MGEIECRLEMDMVHILHARTDGCSSARESHPVLFFILDLQKSVIGDPTILDYREACFVPIYWPLFRASTRCKILRVKMSMLRVMDGGIGQADFPIEDDYSGTVHGTTSNFVCKTDI